MMRELEAKSETPGRRSHIEMKNFVLAFIVIFVAVPLPLRAQTKPDEEAVRKLPRVFCDAWDKHDGHEMANIMADDLDYVTVGATWIHGRSDFEKFHTRLLSGRLKQSMISPLQIEVRFLRPDIAVVHWSWTMTGDKNPDGTAKQPRYGLMTWVAEKRNPTWLVVSSQNDNSFPGVAPEFDGIQSPMPMPDQVGTQPSNPK
jgi:uncharacterized protein (TIGR02246 family)